MFDKIYKFIRYSTILISECWDKIYLLKTMLSNLIQILSNHNSSISDKIAAVKRIAEMVAISSDDTESEMEEKDRLFHTFPISVQNSLDAYFEIKYSNKGYNNIPKSKGKWSGEAGNSIWMPDNNLVPERNMYSNPDGMTWRKILDFYKVKNGILFQEGEPVFDELAWEKVVLRYEDIGRDELLRLQQNERSVLHNLAFDKLAKSKGWSLEQTYKYKEENNLVWHEKSDCKTLLLVPRMIHDNITHYGGVSMLRCLEL